MKYQPLVLLICLLVSLFAMDYAGLNNMIMFPVASMIIAIISYAMFPGKASQPSTEPAPELAYNNYGENIAVSTSKIAIGGANVSHFTDKLAHLFANQVAETSQIAQRVECLESGNNELLAATTHAQEAIDRSNQETQQSYSLLEQALDQQSAFQAQIGESTESLSNLKIKADAIGSIVSTINQLADQTNMLALNAAIEAARAGEQGRGFAVVADEVRELAKKTTEATNGIEGVLSEIASATADSVSAIDGVSQSGAKMAELINATADVVKQNNDTAYTAKSAMEQVLRTVEEHNQTNQGITQNVRSLANGTKELEEDLGEVSSKVLSLCNQTEDIFRQLHVFGLQNRNSLVKDVVLNAAAAVGEAFEQAITAGQITEHALFDMRYDQIENTNPPKFTTPFDTFTDQVLPPIQEAIVAQYNYMIYAGAVDKNGYFPTHNKKFSKPLTGDYDTDLANNRTKRIFDDYTGKRCGSNTESFLLQTYKRDTGEVMHDLSAPIYVFGKHWGGFRIGYQAQ